MRDIPRPTQAAVPEPSLDAFAQALFEEPKQMVDAERFNRGFVRAGEHKPRFTLSEPPSRTIAADLAM